MEKTPGLASNGGPGVSLAPRTAAVFRPGCPRSAAGSAAGGAEVRRRGVGDARLRGKGRERRDHAAGAAARLRPDASWRGGRARCAGGHVNRVRP
ncbi:hypothetical protein PSMK_05830 [Phycisphaera mikurensis NBRC 102666]|uniref:Uncharacterized protein n=1 Tax=Phycisphaera mikurensis (strain NBRC 102666 / KCTC 22515 / FYK2301M01) TaxID=1142394 RepID=I0IBV4_PHYMF|nr:hypothetical protein PSMK_05830 [Phycisphaera mikurensis NBRC 102666]